MPTVHIGAEKGDFAETVLLPGDPLRAKYIAETFFTKPKLVTTVRNVLGYTGTYQGVRVSVMATGMGIPSSSIYCTELIRDYGVKNLIRVGSAGAYSTKVNVRDVVIASGACTDSTCNRMRFGGYDFAAIADWGLVQLATEAAAKINNYKTHIGNIFSSDHFYHPDEKLYPMLNKMQVKCIEMEAAGMYGVCAEYGGKGLAICTITDIIPGCGIPTAGQKLSSDQRQTALNDMIKIGLAVAVGASKQSAKSPKASKPGKKAAKAIKKSPKKAKK